jgi:hypothetical protein
MLYNKNNFAVGKVANKDGLRRNLHCVRFEADKTVATDGHRLVIMTTPKGMTLDDFPVIPNINCNIITDLNGGVSLPLESVRGFKFNKPNRMPILDCAVLTRNGDNGLITINHTDLQTTRQSECRVVDADFPDYLQVIPKTAPKAVIGLNASLLKDICDIATGLSKIPFLKISIYDEDHPQLIECYGGPMSQTMTAVIMPVRLGEDHESFIKHPVTPDVWDWTI